MSGAIDLAMQTEESSSSNREHGNPVSALVQFRGEL